MSRGWGSAARILSHRGAAGLALTLVLAGCTGSADAPGPNDGGRTAVAQPTGSEGAGAPEVEPEYVYPDPMSDDEVVFGRRVRAGAFPAIWPETSLADVALVQLATLDGHETWRLTPEETAERFAVEVLGWSRRHVRSSVRAPKHSWWPMSEVRIRSTRTSDGEPVALSMRAFGPWGSGYRWRSVEPGRVWSVERVDTDLLALDALFDGADPRMLLLAGALQVPDPTRVAVSIDLFDGPLGGPSVPFPSAVTDPDADSFHTHGEVGSASGDGPVALTVTLTDRRSGALLGLDALPLGPPRTTPGIETDDDRRIWPVASIWYVTPEVAEASPFRPSRSSATGAAERFAVEVLGWDPEDVSSHVLDGWDSTVVAVWNERMANGDRQPPLTLVTVAQEVKCISNSANRCHGWNSTGYWTVASADSALAELDLARARFDGELLRIPVSSVGGLGSRHLELELSDGVVGTGQAPWIRPVQSRVNQRRSLSVWSVVGDGWVTALVSVVDDATGTRMAVDAFPILIPE